MLGALEYTRVPVPNGEYDVPLAIIVTTLIRVVGAVAQPEIPVTLPLKTKGVGVRKSVMSCRKSVS